MGLLLALASSLPITPFQVREIEQEAYVKPEATQQKDTKQAAAVDLISRLNDFHINSDPASVKALEEWQKRKMERAKQRGLGKKCNHHWFFVS